MLSGEERHYVTSPFKIPTGVAGEIYLFLKRRHFFLRWIFLEIENIKKIEKY